METLIDETREEEGAEEEKLDCERSCQVLTVAATVFNRFIVSTQ